MPAQASRNSTQCPGKQDDQASHGAFATLATQLAEEFSEVRSDLVLRELLSAREAANWVGVSATEAVEMTGRIARHQLMLLAGRVEDIARLDPERHAGRR